MTSASNLDDAAREVSLAQLARRYPDLSPEEQTAVRHHTRPQLWGFCSQSLTAEVEWTRDSSLEAHHVRLMEHRDGRHEQMGVEAGLLRVLYPGGLGPLTRQPHPRARPDTAQNR